MALHASPVLTHWQLLLLSFACMLLQWHTHTHTHSRTHTHTRTQVRTHTRTLHTHTLQVGMMAREQVTEPLLTGKFCWN